MADPATFAKQYGGIAQRVGQRLNVDPAILLGQWGLETGWGKSVVPGTNNLGNIKDFTGGGVAAVDNMTGSNDNYRAFETPDAFADHYAGLIERKYPGAIGSGKDPLKFAQALQAGGYAEDPAYVRKMVNVTKTVRGAPGVMDTIASAIFPAAQAGTLPQLDMSKVKFLDDSQQLDMSKVNFADNSAATAAPAAQPKLPDLDMSKVRFLDDESKGDEKSFVENVGGMLREIPRQVGLTARYGLEGVGQAAQVLTEPIRMAVNPALDALGLPQASATGQVMSSVADTLGLPSPQGANERVVGDITRLMAGAGGVSGAANKLAQGATGVTQSALSALGMNPGQQIISAAGAGGAGGSVREAGGGPVAQAVASLAGGIAAPVAANAAQRGVAAIGRRLPVVGSASPGQVEQRIQLTMERSGVDWGAVPERVRQQVRSEVAKALRTGDDLNADAIRRLIDFSRVDGAQPTRGTLTLDPVQLTREKNLAKSAANSSDTGLQGLARIENENNSALIRALNQQGADTADDAYAVGQRAIDQIQGGLDSRKSQIDALYSAARDSQGRSFPLDGRSFADNAIKALDDNLAGGFLPPQIREHLNKISAGEVPFTVDYAEQLKTVIGNLQRGATDGNARYALGLVRSALDDAPPLPLGQQTAAQGARAVNPGNLPAVVDDTTIGQDAIDAFNKARAANRSMMQWVESSPAIKAVYEGKATPDQFVNKFLVGSGVSTKDMATIKRAVADSPEALQSIRSYIATWLKEKALSGASDEVGKFSASNYNKALKALGGNKLSVFFDQQEIEQLRAIGRVGSYMTTQPAGSAVNNSNSGALVLGRGLDFLDAVSSKVPLLGIGPTIQGVIQGARQGAAQRVAPSLVNPAQRVPLSQLAVPASVYGSLFGASTIPPSQD
ncbi:glycoside hydrolase family 73 protein [Pusillimonas minor]|uniref:Glucosaminidase domain-containing protein n=1 Tax=Pusillimonas minor TaxID=2697024 RepID=A0A842HNS1_9BURK|nr:glucosaminidase domain-containing protein [Pusillimonas minor]MBC2768555.1 glucosaminidase domain-containing protein [Pusillimonas minor]